MRELKVGDKVKIIGIKSHIDEPIITRESGVDSVYKGYIGNIYTLESINSNRNYKYKFKGEELVWCIDELQLIDIKVIVGGKLL